MPKKETKDVKKLMQYNFDFAYLLELERLKLNEMLKEFTEHSCDKRIIRDLKLAITLIDLYENGWFDKIEITPDYEIIDNNTVNYKNIRRFYNLNEEDLKRVTPAMLLKEKAWHLYHKLRVYRMRSWWD